MNLQLLSKARGKRIDNNEWVYGYYCLHEKVTLSPMGTTEQQVEDNKEYLIINDSFADWNMPNTLQSFVVDPETVSLYILEHDKNNKEIYEGMILKTNEADWIGKVVFERSGFELIGVTNEGFSSPDWERCEIIDDVYNHKNDVIEKFHKEFRKNNRITFDFLNKNTETI